MPLIDVNDVLLDPDVAGQSFIVYRRQEIVNSFGEATTRIKRIPNVFGSVQPSGDQSLIRDEGYDAQGQTIKVATPFRLRGVAKGPAGRQWKPDRIFWAGNFYEVTSNNDWETFGRGFIEVDAVEIKWPDFPPQFLTSNVGQLDFSRPNSNSSLAHGAGGGLA